MRTAKSWIDVIHPAAHIGAEGELERQIKRIQEDAIHACICILTLNAANHVRGFEKICKLHQKVIQKNETCPTLNP